MFLFRKRFCVCFAVAALSVGLGVSCANPAVMLVDPVSQAYYDWQGYDESKFVQAAGASGYRLTVQKVTDGSQLASEIDKINSQEGSGKSVVLVIPPIFQRESGLAAERYPSQRFLILGEAAASFLDRGALNLSSLEVDRVKAFEQAAELARNYLSRTATDQSVVIAMLVDGPQRAAELKAFSDNLGKNDRLKVQEFVHPLSGEDIRRVIQTVKDEKAGIVFLFMGESNIETMRSLSDWKGLIVTERAAGSGGNIPGLLASVEVPWDTALRALLSEAGKSPRVKIDAELKVLKNLESISTSPSSSLAP